MNKNDNLLQRIGTTEDLADKKETKSLVEVSKDIQKAIQDVTDYQEKLKNIEPPYVD